MVPKLQNEPMMTVIPVIQLQKISQSEYLSPRKVSISKPLFFNAHENEAVKFVILHAVVAEAHGLVYPRPSGENFSFAVACFTGRSDNGCLFTVEGRFLLLVKALWRCKLLPIREFESRNYEVDCTLCWLG